MEAVRKIVDGSSLSSIINLPVDFRNRRLEILIMPADEEKEVLSGSVPEIVQSLIGSIPNDSEMSLSDYRKERLTKYEAAD